MNFNFGEVLSRAWQITWKYKVLWIFGILAGCNRGGGGNRGSSNVEYQTGSGDNLFPRQWQIFFENLGGWLVSHWWVMALIGLVFLVLILVAIFLGTIGRIGLIKGTLDAEAGAESLSFGTLFSESMPFFWRVFGLSLLIFLAFLVILSPLIFFGVVTAGVGFLCILPLLCLLVPVGIVVNLILELANVAIVKENVGIWDGFRRGWEMIRTNIGPLLVMALILFAISLAIGLIIAMPIFIIVIPAFIASIGMGQGSNISYIPLIVAGLCFAAYLPVAWLLNGVLTTYIGSAWTLTYLRLSPPAADNTPVVAEGNA